MTQYSCQTRYINKNFVIVGAVPALEYEEGKGIFDSAIINAYLDEKYPEVPVQSADPLRRAQDKMLVELFSGVSVSKKYIFSYYSDTLSNNNYQMLYF